MDFTPSPRAADLSERVRAFVEAEMEPVEPNYHREITRLRESGGDPWRPLPVIGELQAKARAQGLWNLFLPVDQAGDYAERFGTDGRAGLSNVDYAPVAEQMGRSFLAADLPMTHRYGYAKRDLWVTFPLPISVGGTHPPKRRSPHGEDDPDHRRELRARRGDGPAVRRPRPRPRAVRPAY